MTINPNQTSRRVVLFLFDGVRSDGFQKADTPFLDRLIEKGAHSFNMRTVMPTTTLPCHTSLFFSVPPTVHGIFENTWKPFSEKIPGLFDLLHEKGLPAATFFNWEPLRDLWSAGSSAASFFLKDQPGDEGRTDRELSELARAWLSSHDWSFGFIYLHNADKTGHASGWMSDAYLKAIANADRCIENVCKALPPDTLIVVTSDHGGHDHTHHSNLDEDLTVPLILAGPGIPMGVEIPQPLCIMDLAPTIACFLGLSTPGIWQGREIVF